MLTIIGLLITFGAVFGGYVMAGGIFGALMKPAEYVSIGGAALGIAIAATPGRVMSGLLKNLPRVFKGGRTTKDFLDCLVMQYEIYNKVRKEGILAIESDANSPESSEVFKRYPKFLADHGAVDFFADALRQLVNGIDANAIEMSIETDLETHEKEIHAVPQVLSRVGDALPGLGIVVAVLGIIIAMGHLDGPPAQLGYYISAALVGTFLGVLLAYGLLNPLANKLETVLLEDELYLNCLATGFRSFAQGLAPMVSVEIARKAVFHAFRPDVTELNNAAKKRV